MSIDATALEGLVLQALAAAGWRGATADEIRALYPDLAYSSITARPASLLRKRQIVRPGKPHVRRGVSGRNQMVMFLPKFAPQE
jgi:hypothetical protein